LYLWCVIITQYNKEVDKTKKRAILKVLLIKEEIMAKRKKNYLNNKDMLKEIHLSKISYCSFADPVEDNQQDFIIESKEEIFGTQNVQIGKDDDGEPIMGDVPVIELARQARATRLTKLDIPTDVDDILAEDVVFRVMTNEHIPRVPKKKSKAVLAKEAKQAKANAVFEELMDDDAPVVTTDPNVELVPMRVTFPPFFHYRLLPGLTELQVVGKSQWKGGLETGEFSKDHGRTTGNLAMMYIKLCERYGTRGNWRGYTYNDEMQGQALLQLSQIGLQFNELKSQNPFAYYTAAVTNSFTRVLNIEKKMQNIRDDILESNGLTPSWTRQYENDKNKDMPVYDYNYGKPKKDKPKEPVEHFDTLKNEFYDNQKLEPKRGS